MKNTFGNSLTVTLFGESHGEAIGAVLDGLAAGIEIDGKSVSDALAKRRPSLSTDTARKEKDEYRIISGVYGGKTTGTPLCVVIPNTDVKSGDYAEFSHIARPSHADYTAYVKYGGYNDHRGGGRFSGRITAALVAAGAIVSSALGKTGIKTGTHILSVAGVKDREFSDVAADVGELQKKAFPVLSDVENEMTEKILAAKKDGDSVGGILQTAVVGVPAGIGEPWFDSVESVLSHALFSIGGIKGVEFGAGFKFAEMRGSEANDPFFAESGKIYTKTNNNGGINGGITNGMPIIFNCAVKPTPSIAKRQETVDFKTCENAEIEVTGRHDPAIIRRAAAVVDAVTAIAIADLLTVRYGTDVLKRGIPV